MPRVNDQNDDAGHPSPDCGIGQASFGSASFGATGSTAAGWAVTAAFVGLLIAAAAVLFPAWRDQRAITATAARRTLERPRQVWWMRYGVDLWLLLGSAVVFYLTSRNGYQLVLVPEGLPTLSVNYGPSPARPCSGPGRRCCPGA